MALLSGTRPAWLTFDCYGTLTQWDEGLVAVVSDILAGHGQSNPDVAAFLSIYDGYEHAAEQATPFRDFKTVSAEALERTMADLGLQFRTSDAEMLVSRIAAFPPFPEVSETLARFKAMGYRLCVISNTDDDLIAGNIGQMGGHIDRVITAEQAGAYKPSAKTFAHAHRTLGVTPAEVVHICASPHLDLAAARDIGFRCIWVDRGTARKPLPDYVPDATVPSLEPVPTLLAVFDPD